MPFDTVKDYRSRWSGSDASLRDVSTRQRALFDTRSDSPVGSQVFAGDHDGPAERAVSFEGIVGESPAMREIFQRIDKVAATDANICVVGESGTGKELVARAIHHRSGRHCAPFVTLDCTTIPEGLMESQLFGHVRGAFTGAVDHRDGVFYTANTGTLFIDELSELGLTLQAKLLRVIQSREFWKVGGSRAIQTNIRLITATNKDLRVAVHNGSFREDLYYRVAVVMLRVPPLRERPDDIPLLVNHFIRRFSERHDRPIRGVSPRAMARLMSAPWPGNVRQLENVVEQAVVLAETDVLGDRELLTDEPPMVRRVDGPAFPPGLPLCEVERRHILATLERAGGNRTETARLLQISLRSLQYKLKAYAATTWPDTDRPVAEERKAARPVRISCVT